MRKLKIAGVAHIAAGILFLLDGAALCNKLQAWEASREESELCHELDLCFSALDSLFKSCRLPALRFV